MTQFTPSHTEKKEDAHSKLFETILKHAKENGVFEKRTRQALEWYRRKIHAVFGTKQAQLELLRPEQDTRKKIIYQPTVGSFFTFKYNPKLRETLPYYDRFPLVLIIRIVPGGFIGLNFHYISPKDRAVFMDRLYKYMTIDTKLKRTKLNIKYQTLKGNKNLSYYKPCIKKYLYKQIGNMFYPIYPHEWDIALFLPTEKFIKEKKDIVWDNSKKEYK